MRVQFCGCIEGSVTVRRGESESDAIARAEGHLNDILARVSKQYAREDLKGTAGAVVGLEPA